ncbi:MAG: DNA mismatch repair endonuclease MutL [Candidatus Thorarchaeota archaeon]
MGRIRQLPEDVVSLIAAGEVIEGPSSVVKELIENSLDAGATEIDIAIEAGGIDRIVVSDNGSGILREDCPLAIQRHTTSKISRREDIDKVNTYGFRGEALASMAAVADVRIDTRAAEEDVGRTLTCRPGQAPVLTDSARPVGTTVEVTGLFAEIPARRKHLSSPKTEGQRVLEIVLRHAMVRNDVGFRVTRDGELVLRCPPGQTRRERVTSLWGTRAGELAVDVDYQQDGVTVAGMVIRPPASRANRTREYFSVLRRPVDDPGLCSAAESAFATLLMRGRYPMLCIDISPETGMVDVNVHPAKWEVRISDYESVVRAVASAIRQALTTRLREGESVILDEFIEGHDKVEPPRSGLPADRVAESLGPSFESQAMLRETDGDRDTGLSGPRLERILIGGNMRIIGQLNGLYLLIESEDGLLVVDQHAAHERVVYERLRERVNRGCPDAQELLQPVVISLSPMDVERILSVADHLRMLGYDIAPFGPREVIVSSFPEVLGHRGSVDELEAIVDEILDIGEDAVADRFMDEVVKITACHSAIRAGQELTPEEAAGLLREMTETPNWYLCPHGRPTVIRIGRRELDLRFRRV